MALNVFEMRILQIEKKKSGHLNISTKLYICENDIGGIYEVSTQHLSFK